MSEFDVYHKWLGIPPAEQPPNHYRLLGISLFENDRAVIIAALDQRELFLRKKGVGPQGDLAEPLLEHLQQARLCLLNRLMKAQYDAALRQQELKAPGTAAPANDPGERGGVSPPVISNSNQGADADPFAEAAAGFQLPDEADLKDASAISKGMQRRSRRWSWAINLVAMCCFAGGVWWLMDRGFLPQLKALLQPANDQQAAEDSSDSEADEEPDSPRDPRRKAAVAKNKQPTATSNAQAEDRKPPTKSAAVVRRPSKTLGRATDTARFARHQTAVLDFALSADGRFLATAGPEGDCRVWNVTTGETTARFTGHSGHVHAVALSPDGNQVLSSGDSLKLWNATTGKELAELTTSRRPSRAIQFWPDNQQVATVGAGAIEIWNLTTRKPIRTISGVHPFCGSLALTGDSLTLAAATGGQAEETTLFDANSGKTIRSFAGHQMRISSIALSKDGTSLWTASGEHTARRWDTKTGATQAVFAHADVLALSPDERFLATGGLNGLVSIWNAQTGSGLFQLPRQKLRILDITFLPQVTRSVSEGEDGGGEHLLIAGDSTDTDGQTATIQLWHLPKLDPDAPGSRPIAIPVAGSTPNAAPSNTESALSDESPFGVKKLPLPSDDQRVESKKLVREIFKQDFARALRAPDKAQLAEKLLAEAKSTTDDPAGQYELFQEANDLAIAAGDVDVASKILDAMTATFAVDALEVQSTTLRKLSTTVKSGTTQERLAESLLKLAEACATESRYDSAIEATKAATLLAIKAKNLKLRDTAKSRTEEYLLKKKS